MTELSSPTPSEATRASASEVPFPVLPPVAGSDRPREVRHAVAFGVGAILLGWVHAALTLDQALALIRQSYSGIPALAEIPDSTWKLSILASSVFGSFFMALVLLGLWFRKNWVRLVFLVLTVFGTLGFVFSALVSASLGPVSNAIRSVQTALWVVGALSLMRPVAVAWFKKPAAESI